ncbi:MAG: hypothetical protein ACPGUV_03470 [Polyangiales bacterium]
MSPWPNVPHELEQRLRRSTCTPAQVEHYLDGLSATTRLAALAALSPRGQAELFACAAGHRDRTLDDLVPGREAGATATHQGANTLPVASRFAKRFCRPATPERSDVLYGYNHMSTWLTRALGPGAFVASAVPGAHGLSEIFIDYRAAVPWLPAGWPRPRRNDVGLAKLAFGGLGDCLRGVSADVSVGRASRDGRWMDSWFVLCRVDGA